MVMAPGTARRPHLLLVTGQGKIPLGYVRRDSRVYLIARERSAQWPIDVLREGRAELLLPEGPVRGAVTLLTSPQERDEVLAMFRSAYGDDLFARWYEHPARVLRVDSNDGPDRVAPTERYYDWLAAEFDNVADDYDRHITGNRMNRLLRDRSLRLLRSTFADARALVEVGCGSGMETLPLLREGHEILAVDISERMLATVRAKARSEGLSERLRTQRLRASELPELVRSAGEVSFDGAYSTYGAINCEPRLAPIADGFSRLLPPGRHLIVGIYNRWCLFELLGYSASLQWARALGRRRNPVPVGSSRFCVDVYAYSTRDVEREFQPWFARESTEGVPVILPPSDLVVYAEKLARHFDRLALWDRELGSRWPLTELGDHFLMTLRRRDVAS